MVLNSLTIVCSSLIANLELESIMSHRTLTLKVADKIANAAIITVEEKGWAPVVVTILNGAGNLVVKKAMDGSAPVGIPDFSHAKAYTAIAMKIGSRQFRDRYTTEPTSPAKWAQMLSMVNISQGMMAPFPGGVCIKDGVSGEIIGSVGVSGATGDQDEYAALQGIEAVKKQLKCITDPPSPSI